MLIYASNVEPINIKKPPIIIKCKGCLDMKSRYRQSQLDCKDAQENYEKEIEHNKNEISNLQQHKNVIDAYYLKLKTEFDNIEQELDKQDKINKQLVNTITAKDEKINLLQNIIFEYIKDEKILTKAFSNNLQQLKQDMYKKEAMWKKKLRSLNKKYIKIIHMKESDYRLEIQRYQEVNYHLNELLEDAISINNTKQTTHELLNSNQYLPIEKSSSKKTSIIIKRNRNYSTNCTPQNKIKVYKDLTNIPHPRKSFIIINRKKSSSNILESPILNKDIKQYKNTSYNIDNVNNNEGEILKPSFSILLDNSNN